MRADELLKICAGIVILVSILLLFTASGSDITQTTVRNGYIVNPDNITISMDGNITVVLIGQNVQFMCGGKETGQVTIRGIKDTPTEGYLFKSDTTGWFDTSGMEEGMYNATYGDCWELLAVSKPLMDLRLMVGTKEVTGICEGTPLRVDLETNLDKNDCVDLVVRTPEGYLLTQNPADPNQKFDDINVSQLLEYGSENESKWINTTGWEIGTYTFSVRTEEENARGLDVCSKETELAVLRVEINIEAEKCVVVESEKVRLTVTGAPKHNITISSSDPTHTIFPADYEDNPPFDSSGFNDTIDENGKRKYVVYFNDTGTYTIKVTDTTAGLSDCVDIVVEVKMVSFEVPSTVVIGEAFIIKGVANIGNTVDIAVENYVYPELNDIPIDENGEFETEIDTGTTNITPFTVPGSVRLKAYIDRAVGAGEIGANETEDGSVAILIVRAGLTAELSTDCVAQGGNFMVNGTARGVDNVDMVVVAPKGSNGSMICPNGTPLQAGTNIYYAVVPVTPGGKFSKKICVGMDVDTGNYLVVVFSKGRDGVYGRGYNNLTEALTNYNLSEKTQAEVLDILMDATIDTAGSDDLMWIEYINVIPRLNVSISKNAVLPDDSFEVYGNASADYVEIVAISPGGGGGTGLDGLYGVTIYTVPTFSLVNTSYNLNWNITLAPLIPNGTTNRPPGTNITINLTGPETDKYNFYKRIKVDGDADTGNYTILVLSPGIDGVYGDSLYKYIDTILDLDGAGPELGVIDVSNKTQEEIVRVIEDATVNAVGSDDLIWMGNIIVSNDSYIDTGQSPNPYPSISGTHNGTIVPANDITVSKIFVYPCVGTGGHAEYVRIWGNGVDAHATWNGYGGEDWNILHFNRTFTLEAGKEYNFTIKTGSYPQIFHEEVLETLDGSIVRCEEFVDANGKRHKWIPAFKIYA
ncbi:MAG: hypothetical protein OCU24_06535 [Candidatus Methanospirare jalkutatii]|nr:hypothetical protein [Candidatus Methanospirare jalkutatii]